MGKPTFTIDEAIEYVFLCCRSTREVLEDIVSVLHSERDRYSDSEWQCFWNVVERDLRRLEWAVRHLPAYFDVLIQLDVDRTLIEDMKSIQF